MRKLSKEESYDFWFNNPEFDEHDQFGEDYYVNDFYKKIVFNLDIPDNGNIVVMGSHKCVTFGTLSFCTFFKFFHNQLSLVK